MPIDQNVLGSNPICDSVVLTLSYLKNTINVGTAEEQTIYHYYGDVYSTLNLQVYQLDESFESVDDKIYNTVDELLAKTFLEGETGDLIHEPEGDEALTISLDKDSFGKDVLANYSNDHATFLTAMKGLQLIAADGEDGSVIGFDRVSDNTFVTVYYHNDEGETKSLQLGVSDAARLFNHIGGDLSGTLISGLSNEGDTVSSKTTDNMMYLQSSTGVRVLIEIPYMNEFFTANPGVLINKVELILPIDGATAINGFADSPPVDLALHEATDANLLVRDSDGALSYITNEGNELGANKDNNYYPFSEEDNEFRMNLGLYVQKYALEPTADFRIIASAYGEGISINRAVLFDAANSTEKTTFKFYYSKRGE